VSCIGCERVQGKHLTGGIGVIGGLRQSPKFLEGSIQELKEHLEDKNAPFGVDLLIPQVGGGARKTNVCNSCYKIYHLIELCTAV